MKPQQFPTQEYLSNCGFAFDIAVVDKDDVAQDVTTWTFQAGGWIPEGGAIVLPMTVTPTDNTGGIVRVSAEAADVSALFSSGDEKTKTVECAILANVPGLPLPAMISYGTIKIKRVPALWQ